MVKRLEEQMEFGFIGECKNEISEKYTLKDFTPAEIGVAVCSALSMGALYGSAFYRLGVGFLS